MAVHLAFSGCRRDRAKGQTGKRPTPRGETLVVGFAMTRWQLKIAVRRKHLWMERMSLSRLVRGEDDTLLGTSNLRSQTAPYAYTVYQVGLLCYEPFLDSKSFTGLDPIGAQAHHDL